MALAVKSNLTVMQCLERQIHELEKVVKTQVKLEAGRSETDEPEATFDLFVNSESMLIERIEGEQHLADGTNLVTTVRITPTQVDHESLSVGEVEPSPEKGR